jgi:YVTN family beta-propeller protein
MEFGLLGPLEVRQNATQIRVVGHRTRRLLCVLLLRPNQVLSIDYLIDALWGEEPPPGAAHALHGQVSRLRAALRPGANDELLVTAPGGYRLQLNGHRLDIEEFERLVADARRMMADGHSQQAVSTLRAAEALWRGPPLMEFLGEEFTHSEVNRLDELHLAAIETRLEAQLAAEDTTAAVVELEALAASHPFREEFRRLLMLGLYRSGQQSRALEVFRQTQSLLTDELGVDPSPQLRELMQRILEQAPELSANGRSPHAAVDTPLGAAASDRSSQTPTPREGSPDRPPSDAPRAGTTRTSEGGWRHNGRRLLAAAVVLALVVATGAGLAFRTDNPRGSGVRQADVVSELDSSGSLRGQIGVGKNPTDIVAADGTLWVSNADDATVTRIDPSSLRPEAVVAGVGRDPAGVAVAAGSAWVVSPTDNTVTAINAQTDLPAQTTVKVGQHPSGIAYGAGRLWITNSIDSTVSSFDPRTPADVRTLDAGTAPTGITANTEGVWVTNAGDNTVWELDPVSGRREQDVSVGLDPTAVATGSSGVWVANHLDGTVTHIDPGTGSVRATIPVGDGPTGIVVTPRAVWVTTEYAGELVRVDPVSNRVTARRPMPGAPRGIAVLGKKLWLASGTSYLGHRGGTLRVRIAVGGALDVNFPNIDPGLGSDYITDLIASATTDSLVTYARAPGSVGDSLVPDLAVSLPPATATTTEYLFHLRRGIRYSTGAPVRAGDVRASIERTFRAGIPDDMWLTAIEGADACLQHRTTCDLSHGIVTDDAAGTVRFILSHPDPLFLVGLATAQAAILPVGTPLIDPVKGRPLIPATGPYVVTAFLPRHRIELRRNPYFHQWSRAAQPDGYVDGIIVDITPHTDSTIRALETREVDYLDDQEITPAQVESATTNYPILERSAGGLVTSFAFLNTTIPPFNNIQARRALNYAVDRAQAVRQRGFGRTARVTCQILPAGMPGFRPYCPYTISPNSTGDWTAPDLAKAQQLVQASGTLGQTVTVWEPPHH